jgi:hypothetical protein
MPEKDEGGRMKDEGGVAPDSSSFIPRASSVVRAVTVRSVGLGLLGGGAIVVLAPYNDFVLNNTYLVGNSLPVVVVMTLFVLGVLVNGPLHRWAPRYALSAGELTCIVAMLLAACAIPGSGVLRYLSPSLVMPFYRARDSQQYLQVLEQVNLPAWMFPGFAGDRPSQWMNDPIVTGYQARWTDPQPIPYGAWVRPIVSWGVFVAALWGAVLSMMALLRRQWVENERLAFPLAQVHLALIEQPQPGHLFNQVLRRRSFWAALAMVGFIHIWNGSMTYWRRPTAMIPLDFNLSGLFSETPWSYTEVFAQEASLFFIVAALTYFASTSLSLTLWVMFLSAQVLRMVLGSARGDPAIPGPQYQHFGAVLAYAAGALWTARAHLSMVVRHALGRFRPGEPRGRYISFGVGFWFFVGSVVVMIGWLHAAGMTLAGAASVVGVLLTMFLAVTRIVAETGLVFVGAQFPVFFPVYLAASAGYKALFPLRDMVIGTFANAFNDLRENLGVYSSHSVAVADRSVFGGAPSHQDPPAARTLGRRMILAMVVMLALAYPIGFFAHLRTEYHYAATIDKQQESPINKYGGDVHAAVNMERPTLSYQQGLTSVPYSRLGQTGVGFGLTALLTAMHLRFAWWPLHPVGMVLVYTFPISVMWFSILVGWLFKVLILRLGGSRLYVQAKPFVLGLIVGESLAIGFWMIVAMVLSALGIEYETIRVLPI